MKPIFQQVALEDGGTLGVVVVVDVVSLARLLGTVLHDEVATAEGVVAVCGLTAGVFAHDDALEPRLALQPVEYPAFLFADSLSPLLTLALHPSAILARILAPHDVGWVLTLAVADLLPHSGSGLSAGFRRLTTSQGVVVAVFLAHALDVCRLPFLDALDTFRALRQSELMGEPMQGGMAHAADFHQQAVLLFGEPLAEPCPLFIGQHPSLDTLTASLAQLGGEWSVNELCGQHSREWVYLHTLISINMIAVSFLKHCVDVVWHSVLSLLIERQQVGVVIQCRKKITVIWYAAALDAEPVLSVLQLAHLPMVVCELCRIAPY